jgi:hypothetical protein
MSHLQTTGIAFLVPWRTAAFLELRDFTGDHRRPECPAPLSMVGGAQWPGRSDTVLVRFQDPPAGGMIEARARGEDDFGRS